MADDRHIPGLALPRTMLRIVAVLCLLLTWLGLYFSAENLVAIVREPLVDRSAPYAMQFTIAFVVIAIAIQFGLLFVGYQLWWLRTNIRGLLLALSIGMVACFIGASWLWTVPNPPIARSAAMATGFGLGSLSLYFLTLFFLWAPALVYWAHCRLTTVKQRRRDAGQCAYCGYDLRGSEGACPECGMASPT